MQNSDHQLHFVENPPANNRIFLKMTNNAMHIETTVFQKISQQNFLGILNFRRVIPPVAHLD